MHSSHSRLAGKHADRLAMRVYMMPQEGQLPVGVNGEVENKYNGCIPDDGNYSGEFEYEIEALLDAEQEEEAKEDDEEGDGGDDDGNGECSEGENGDEGEENSDPAIERYAPPLFHPPLAPSPLFLMPPVTLPYCCLIMSYSYAYVTCCHNPVCSTNPVIVDLNTVLMLEPRHV